MTSTMKKMKKLSYAVVAAAILGASCNKLDEFNPSNTTGDAIWATPEGFTTLVNGTYRDIHTLYGSEPGLSFGEVGTDLWIGNGGNVPNPYYKYENLTPSHGTIAEVWRNIWNGINMCNTGIAKIDKAGFIDQSEKAKRLGELHFMRALYYYHLVEQFGGVMLRTEPTTAPSYTAERSNPEAFYDVMISDLLIAKENLPKDWGSDANKSEYGRASKKSAAGLLARVYLARAYYATGDAAAWFTKAKDAALDVINNYVAYGCELYKTPADLWNPANNRLNKESLFSVTYSLTNVTWSFNSTNGNRLYKWFATKYNGYPGLIADQKYGLDNDLKAMPTWHLLDLFDETKDLRYAATFQENWYANIKQYTWKKADTLTFFKNWADVDGKTIDSLGLAMQITKGVIGTAAEKRKIPYVTFDRNDTYDNPVPGTPAKINPDPNKRKFFVYMKKFLDPNRPTPTTAGGYNDVAVIRFAEMYLIAAEAFHKLGDNVNAAININKIRERAMKPGATDFLIDASQVNMDFILDERAREFCGEQLRFYDLKRVFRGDDFAEYIKKYNPDITAVTKYHRLRPVPQSEMDALLNSADFKQTEGYQ
jgi:starch-binding outer membrane protein, SusD/RagB family